MSPSLERNAGSSARGAGSPAGGGHGLTRRGFLLAGIAVAVLAGGIASVLRTRGYRVDPARVLTAFRPWQFVVLEHAARRITAPDRLEDATIPRADDLDVAGFVDTWAARLPAKTRRDLGRLLAYLEHVAPLAAGHSSRFTRLGPREQDRVLASLETSSHPLLRAGFDGLKSLVFMGYYRDPRTWNIVGYDGPLVGRPPGGWQ